MGQIVSSNNLRILIDKKESLHNSSYYKALNDYKKRNYSEITFRKDDNVLVYFKINSLLWEARNLRTRKKGTVNPNNLIKYDFELKEYIINRFQLILGEQLGNLIFIEGLISIKNTIMEK